MLTIKIECGCGTRFKFDVEPEEGEMPVPVECPHCGADGTEQANQKIREQLGLAEPPPKIEVPKPFKAQSAPSVPKEGEAGKSPLKLAEREKRPPQHTVTLPPQVKKVGDVCPKHNVPTTNSCFYCKKSICPQCMSKFGFFCSTRCRHEAESRGMKIPIYEGHESVIQERKVRRVKMIAAGVSVLIVFLLLGWAWIEFVASKPRVKVAIPLEDADHVKLCAFLNRDELLLATDKELRLYNTRDGSVSWTANLTSYQPADFSMWDIEDDDEREEAFQKMKEEAARLQNAGMKLTPNEQAFFNLFRTHTPMRTVFGGQAEYFGRPGEIWGLFPSKVVVFDWKTGQVKKEIDLRGEVLYLEPEDAVVFATAGSQRNRGTLTRVDLRSGRTASAPITLPGVEREVSGRSGRRLGTGSDAGSELLGGLEGLIDAQIDASTFEDNEVLVEKRRLEFISTGANVAQLEVKLLEKKVHTQQILKPEDIKPAEEPGTSRPVRASDAAQLAQQMIYEQVRDRGGISTSEDVSRYEVKLGRLLEEGAVAWKGQMEGPPHLYPLQTVDVLASGKQVIVFDKQNRKLWEAPLAFPIAGGLSPCLEDRGSVYILDAQTLHCFDLQSGSAKWRLPGEGMSTVSLDPKGMIYLKMGESLAKVDPESGEVLWRMQIFVSGGGGGYGALGMLRGLGLGGREAEFNVIGGDLYVFKAQISSHDVLQHLSRGKDLPTHFRIVRISPKSGEMVWEHYTPKAPVAMGIRDNRLAIVYPNVYKKDPNNPRKRIADPGELHILSYLNW